MFSSNSWSHMCTTLRMAALVFTVVLAITLAGRGQTTISTGSIQGTVSDPSGAIMADANVTITSEETGQVVRLKTTSAGLYTSGSLTPGHYTVRVQVEGFKTVERSVVVQVAVTSSGNVTLQIGNTSEVVEVHGSDVRVNTEQATIQGVLTQQQIDTLPINGRNFIDLAQLEPGVQTQDVGKSTGRIGHSGISVGGRYSESTRVEVDGVDLSDDNGSTFAGLSTSAIQEFSLQQSTMDPSSESTNSGAVNITTRLGTNALHGEGLYLFRDKSLSANFNGGTHPPYQRHDFEGSLGGPLVKNKCFFFVNGERFKQDLGFPSVVSPPLTIGSAVVNQPLRQTLLTSRSDYNAPKGAHLFYKFSYDNSKIVGDPPLTDRLFDNTPTHTLGADFSSGRFTHSIRFLYAKNTEVLQNAPQPGIYDPLPQIHLRINDFEAGINPNVPAATYRSRKQVKYDGAHSFSSHILRYGFSYTRATSAFVSNFLGAGPELDAQVTTDTLKFAADSCDPSFDVSQPLPATLMPCFPGGVNNPLNYPLGGGGTLQIGNGQGFLTEIPGFGLPAGANRPDNRIQWYLADTWKMKPNLTLSFGVHYIRDTGITNSDIAPIPCSAINPDIFNPLPPCTGNILDMFGPGLSARPHDPSKNFAPQVGIAWDIFKNGKTVVRAGASKTYSPSSNAGLSGRLSLLSKGLFNLAPVACPDDDIFFPTANGGLQLQPNTPPTAAHPNGLPIASPQNGTGSICNTDFVPGYTVGTIASDVVALQQAYQAATTAAGPQSNQSFLGNTLDPTGLDAHYRTPYSYQMNVGIQHEIRNGTVLSADFVRNVSLHFPMLIDVNHVGDSRYLNLNAANNAIDATNAAFGCPAGTAGIDCSIGAGASMEDFAGNGLTSTTDFSFVPPSMLGLDPDHAAAFAGIKPSVAQGLFNLPIGRATYNALQVSLRQQRRDPLPFTRNIYLQFSYTLSRYSTPLSFDQNDDQDSRSLGGGNSGLAAGGKDYRNPLSHFGPTAFDRTHQFSVGTTIDFVKPLRVALIGHVYSPLSQSMVILDNFRLGEIFYTDFNGDGTTGDLVPGTNVGVYGRQIKADTLTGFLENYNNTIAGTILPAGQALIGAKLFTKDQLIALGAVADRIPLGPNDPQPLKNRANMGWLKTFDLKVSAPLHVGERFIVEPTAAVYNLFNFANFNIDPLNRPSTALRGRGNTVNGYSTSLSDLNHFRASQGPSLFSLGTARQAEFGMKISF